jgi:hypothetical protein
LIMAFSADGAWANRLMRAACVMMVPFVWTRVRNAASIH